MRESSYDDLQIALNVARDNLKSLNDKIGRDQFRLAIIYCFCCCSPPPPNTIADNARI